MRTKLIASRGRIYLKRVIWKDWHFVSCDRLSSRLKEFIINWRNVSAKEINISHSNLEFLENLIEEPEFTFASKTKDSFGENLLIYKKMIATNNSEDWVQRFGTSKSTIYRVKKEFN